MIKIFRHIRKALLSENRFSVYLLYAMGEIFLIVIGILIALQISNWSESNKSEEEIKNILVLIKENLKEDKAEQEVTLRIGNDFLKYWQSVLKKNPANSDFTNLINQLGVYDFNSNNSGYLSAIRGNKLSLIKNRDLINSITDYYELKFREMENRASAFGRQTLIMTNHIYESLSRTEKNKSIIKRTQLVIDDPVFKETLNELLTRTKDHLEKIGERIKQSELIIKSIDIELNQY